MNFFKSVFSPDPDPSETTSGSVEQEGGGYRDDHPQTYDGDSTSSFSSAGATTGGVWSFGCLIETIAHKSESVLQNYRRDLEEFSSGFKEEAAAIREAIKDLPGTLDAGASVAQESLESVGQAIDDIGSSVWRGTAVIIAQGKGALLADEDGNWSESQNHGSSALSSVRYNRFEAEVHALQLDPSTYCDEPEDFDEYSGWRSGFLLSERAEEIDSLCGAGGVIEGIYRKLVPNVISHETFWFRYFYKFHKLKQVEDARANLVKRVISGEFEEDLSWEFDDDDDDDDDEEDGRIIPDFKKSDVIENPIDITGETSFNTEFVHEGAATEALSAESCGEVHDNNNGGAEPIAMSISDSEVPLEGKTQLDDGDSIAISAAKLAVVKAELTESSRDSDVSVVSSQQSVHNADDLGWDEIEDIESNDEKKVNSSGSVNKLDLQKRLSTAEEDEDLTWDIEDDEPSKQ